MLYMYTSGKGEVREEKEIKYIEEREEKALFFLYSRVMWPREKGRIITSHERGLIHFRNLVFERVEKREVQMV